MRFAHSPPHRRHLARAVVALALCLRVLDTLRFSRGSPAGAGSAPKAVSARGFLVPPLRSGHYSAPSGLICRLAPTNPPTVFATCSVGLFVPAGTLHPPWGSCLSALPCVLNVWRVPASALAGGHRLSRCPRGLSRAEPPRRLRGAPRPPFPYPAPDGRAPPGSPGLREIGVPLRGAFFSAGALGLSRGFGAFAPASVVYSVRCVLSLFVRSPVLTPKARALLDAECLGPSKKTVYTTGSPLPTSAGPVFFGNLPCDIQHQEQPPRPFFYLRRASRSSPTHHPDIKKGVFIATPP